MPIKKEPMFESEHVDITSWIDCLEICFKESGVSINIDYDMAKELLKGLRYYVG